MKFFRDTLMEWSKFSKSYEYSMRRIAIAICFPYALSVGCNIVYGGNTNPLSVLVFQTVFGFVAVGLGYNLLSYIKNDKPKDDNNNNTTNTE